MFRSGTIEPSIMVSHTGKNASSVRTISNASVFIVTRYDLQIPRYQVLFAHVSPFLSEYVPSGHIVFDHATLVKYAATSVIKIYPQAQYCQSFMIVIFTLVLVIQ